MAWIESHQELGAHPKTRKLARLLAVSRPAAVGHLQFLWWWALDYAEDGDLSPFEPIDIASAGEWEGDPQAFVDALLGAGFIDTDMSIHDWDVYAGRWVQERRRNAEKQRRWRARQKAELEANNQGDEGRNRNVTVTKPFRNRATVPNQTVPNQTEPKNGSLSLAGANASKSQRNHLQSVPKPIQGIIPDDFEVTDEMRQQAEGYGVPAPMIDLETEKFRDHFKANGKKMTDWPAAWRNWMRRVSEFAPSQKNGRYPTKLSQAEATRDRLLRVARGDAS